MNSYSQLSIYYQNCGGMKTKTDELYMNILSNTYDIIVLVETWLVPSIIDAEFIDNRYVVYRRDRDARSSLKSHGGGVLVAVLAEFMSKRCLEWENDDIEEVIVSIKPSLTVYAVYIPPNLGQIPFKKHLNNLENNYTKLQNSNIIILADYNIPSLEFQFVEGCPYGIASSCYNPIGKLLLNTMSFMQTQQFNPLRNVNGRTLDLVLCNGDCKVVAADPLLREDRHHPAILCIVDYQPEVAMNKLNISKFHFRKCDYNIINASLASVKWEEEFHDLKADGAVERFYELVSEVIKRLVPKKLAVNRKHPAWYTFELIKVKKRKEKAWIKWKTYGGRSDYLEFSRLRTQFKKMSRLCHKKYINNTEKLIAQNLKGFWSYVSSLKSSKGYPASMTYKEREVADAPTICRMFSSFFQSTFEPSRTVTINDIRSDAMMETNTNISLIVFQVHEIYDALKQIDSNKGAGPDNIEPIFLKMTREAISLPLTLIFNMCIAQGTFPERWKIAHITPVYKSGSKHEVENYRPISILSAIPKVFEKLVHGRVYPVLHQHIIGEQHGFVKNRSTSTNLLLYTQYLFEAMDNRTQVDTIYTDFKKAFDKVDHLILLQKLSFNGIKGTLLRWFISYLSNRHQAVRINGFISPSVPVTSGVPQGSILGPFLFIIFINDIACCFKYSKYLLYADDLKIFSKVKNISDQLKLQDDLNRLDAYCKINRIHLSYAKCKSMSFSKNKTDHVYVYNVGGHSLESVHCIRDLGVMFDRRLHFNTHIEHIVSRAYGMLGFLLRTAKPFKQIKTYHILYTALVRSHLEYAVAIWNPYYAIYSDMIERVQKRYIRTLQYRLNTPKLNYENALAHFTYGTLRSRRTQLEGTVLHNICHSRYDCPDLLSQLQFRVPGRATRCDSLFHLPVARTNAGLRAPLYRLCDSRDRVFHSLDIFASSSSQYKHSIMNMLNC